MSVEVKCKKHPKYMAKRRPRVKCGTCALLWDLRNGGDLYDGTDGTLLVIA